MGCQAVVEATKLTTVMNDKKRETTKVCDTIKPGIDARFVVRPNKIVG